MRSWNLRLLGIGRLCQPMSMLRPKRFRDWQP
jgi:hypothetical protein